MHKDWSEKVKNNVGFITNTLTFVVLPDLPIFARFSLARYTN